MTDSGILYCVVFKDPPNRDPVFSWVTQGSQGLLSDPGRSFVTGVASLSGAAAEYVRKSPELSRGKSHASVAVPHVVMGLWINHSLKVSGPMRNEVS